MPETSMSKSILAAVLVACPTMAQTNDFAILVGACAPIASLSAQPSGTLIAPAPLAHPFTVGIGDVAAETEYGDLGPGLYQFTVRVPPLMDRHPAVSIEVAGERTQPGVVIPVSTTSN